MYVDIPTQAEIQAIARARNVLSVTIYMPTSTVPANGDENQLRARNLFDTAIARVHNISEDASSNQLIENALQALLADPGFWQHLGRSLAIFVTPERITVYRLPNNLPESVTVADRFTVTPLMRAVTFAHSAFVLALSQNSVRLIEVSADHPAQESFVNGLPKSIEEFFAVDSSVSQKERGRIRGDEGHTVRLTQFARAVEHALRPVLNGSSMPLLLAAAEPLASIYRNVSGYPGLVSEGIHGNSDGVSPAELADASRKILDDVYRAELHELKELFAERRNSGRAVTDLSDLARAARSGAIHTLAVDMEAHVPGYVSESGTLVLGDTPLDAIEEITRIAIDSGTRVVVVRAEDLPDGVTAAGILRYSI